MQILIWNFGARKETRGGGWHSRASDLCDETCMLKRHDPSFVVGFGVVELKRVVLVVICIYLHVHTCTYVTMDR